MKNLSEYIIEALKTIKSVSHQKIESNNYDIIQVVDRSFDEGISDEDFEKFIKQDIDEVFKLKESELSKGMDKIIDDLATKEIDSKLPLITKWADSKYKRQSARDKFIEDSKEEIRQRIIKTHPIITIKEVCVVLNPAAGVDPRIFVHADEAKKGPRHYKWNTEAVKAMLDELNNFSIRLKGQERDLRDGIIGWTIEYAAYNGTKCPKNGCAYLTLKLNKETEDIVRHYNKSFDNMMQTYYDEKGSGGYTGD